MESPKDSVSTVNTENDSQDYAVQVAHIFKNFGKTQVLRDISLSVKKGEFLSILGPSGCGKTTLLRIIGGFIPTTSGEVYINGELMGDRAPYDRPTSMVFQHLALFPHMTVFDNVAYGLKVRRLPGDEIKKLVCRALDRVQLEGLEGRFPKQLSGGQQQRVALARSLVLEPAVVLLDEPLGALDMKLRQEMQVVVKKLHAMLSTTFIYVTHDQSEALTMSDRVAIMNCGRIEQIGTPEDIYEHPQTVFVADFIGDTNIFEGEVVSSTANQSLIKSGGLQILSCPSPVLEPGNTAALSVRPQHIVLSMNGLASDNRFGGVIEEKMYKGATYRYIVRLGDGQAVTAELSGPDAGKFYTGDVVTAGWSIADTYPLAES